ncbi:N-acetylglucosamine-6-phosphate deacetylase [Paenibacillus eucommiae]|uniref:N-acetylglucosamine-6-phosphate deacetylase n=1 Tax=Paenibacillus eucommiae TaxID=1355755 RepID=A0ABS4ITF1_9BACL|nr:amidohydrolase family protein [Paenibacillus eucommiae]MBP1990847.1 N-acetylglucosamine-6-phosphate deacetylase [Paenibacillus eucommiae]
MVNPRDLSENQSGQVEQQDRQDQRELLLEGRHYVTGEAIRVRLVDGVIQQIESLSEDAEGSIAADPDSAKLNWIGPGLVDLQVNGHGGFDLNTHPLSVQQVTDLTAALWQEGVTAYLPTIITHDSDNIELAVRIIAEACHQDERTANSIAGIHLEGPFISPEDGARGAHDLAYVKAPDWDLVQRWQEAAEGRITLLTMSPEWPDAPAFIARCVEHGIVVSIGHTAATSEQIAAAVAAGATMSTHLGNGAHLMLPRHPNYIWEQLAQENLWSCVIADGFHVPSSFLQVARKVKQGKFLLVSDAVLYSGMSPGVYNNPVMGTVVLEPDGRLHLQRDERLLAGSAQMLTHGIAHLVKQRICTLAEAWDASSIGPSEAMGLTAQAGLAVGAPADLVVFKQGEDEKLQILETYKRGCKVYGQ